MTKEREKLGNDLAIAIAQSSGIGDNLLCISEHVVTEIEYRHGIDDDLGNVYHDFKIISDGLLIRTTDGYDYKDSDAFIQNRIKNRDVKASACLKNGRELQIEFLLTFLFGAHLVDEVEIYVCINNRDIRGNDVTLSGEIYSEDVSESDLKGALLWLTLQR